MDIANVDFGNDGGLERRESREFFGVGVGHCSVGILFRVS